MPRRPQFASARRRLVPVLVTLALMLVVLPTTGAATAAPSRPGNPLTAGPWGVDTRHELYKAYVAAKGDRRRIIGKMARRPTVFWFNDRAPANDIQRRVRAYVEDAQDGNRNTLVQLAIFRLWPEGEAMKDKPLTLADRASYKRWVRNAAKGLGNARAMVIVEPDLPVALKGWRPAVRLRLARYTARVFSNLPRTRVYLDAGSSDWLPIPTAVKMLRTAGMTYVDGFSLGATHYTSTASEIHYGTALVKALSRAGFRGRKFVIDTADNARPFTYLQYYAKHPRGWFDNAEECKRRAERRCVAVGIPPTTRVGAPRRGVGRAARIKARAHVDAFLWFSRPWMIYARPAYMDVNRLIRAIRFSPYL